MLDALEVVVAAVALAVSAGLAARALYAFCQGALAATHGATSGVERLRALRLRIYTLTGLLGVVLGALALWQGSLAPTGSVLWPAGIMLVFGFFADVSARASGRASTPGDKRAHVKARMRAQRYRGEGGRQDHRRQANGAQDEAAHRRSPHHRRASRKRSSQRRSSRKRSSRHSSRRNASQNASASRSENVGQRRRALRVLGLPEQAGPDEIKRAWRRHAFRHHPDRHVTAGEAQREEHARAFHRARRAYETLCAD